MTAPLRMIDTGQSECGQTPPRAEGDLRLSVTARGIGKLRPQGCMKALFPRSRGAVEAIVINTSGGVTGGDHLRLSAHVETGGHLTLTTQAAERAYRAAGPKPGRVETQLSVAAGGRLNWLPQELILFEGCHLRRRLAVDLTAGAEALIVEPVIFGRAAMGEELRAAQFSDRIVLRRDGRPLYRDGIEMQGDLFATLDRPATGNGARAIVSVVMVSPEAEAMRDRLLPLMGAGMGASVMAPDLLVLRMVAAGGMALRAGLLPVLDELSGGTLPVSWRL